MRAFAVQPARTGSFAIGGLQEVAARGLSRDAIVLHTHQMNLRAFWRQHFEYGRGAAVFRKMRAARDGAPLRIEPMSFYMNLLRFPLKEGWTVHGARMTVLVALAQVANATGFLWSSVRPPTRAGKPISEP